MRRDYLVALDTSCSFIMEKAGSNSLEMSMMSDIKVPSQTKRLKEVTAKHIVENFKRLGSEVPTEASSVNAKRSYKYGSA